MYPLLRELPSAMYRISIRCIFYHFHSLPTAALLTAVSRYHVQLSDVVLQVGEMPHTEARKLVKSTLKDNCYANCAYYNRCTSLKSKLLECSTD